MLYLTTGSSCDICFEGFGKDPKAPTSIECGHVFCNACISKISRLCPLCRTPFDPHKCIKLHLDHESELNLTEDMQRARKLQKSIASIADDGISEPGLRLLIQEGKTFLHSQPRNLHKDLRVAHRMISYLCDVKTTLLSQNQAVDMLTDQIKQLTQEKADLRGQIAQLQEARRYEKETALAVEKSLRDHYEEAVNVYRSTIELYNQVAQQNSELMLKLSTSTKHTEKHKTDSIAPTPSTVTSLLSPVVDQKALSGVAVRDPHSSFLISPLPQFTSNLPSIADSFVPLPDLAEDEEDEEDSTEDDEEALSTPDSERHQPQLRESKDRLEAPTVPLAPFQPERRIIQEPSGLSRTAPYVEHRRPRSSSSPSQPTSRSHSRSRSPFDSIASSTPPMSPLPNHKATVQPQLQPTYQVSSREMYPPSSPQPAFQQPPQDRQILRTRLQDILSDSATSSSLPNMNAYFPASFTNRDPETRGARVSPPPPPSRTDSSNSSNSTSKTPVPQQQSSDGFSHLLASGSTSFANKPTPSATPNYLVGPRISTASAEAKKLEEERRRRQKEEKEKYAQGQEYDRHPVDPDRDTRRSKTSSATVVPTAAPSSGQATRRDQQWYADPVTSNANSTSSSQKRGPSLSNSGTYGRPSGVSSQEQGPAHQARHSGSSTAAPKAPSKSNGPMLPSNPSGIYT